MAALSLSTPMDDLAEDQWRKTNPYSHYFGLYHTDVTVPSKYFTPAVERPDHPTLDNLDLTYLYHDSPENPDHQQMGKGIAL